jgi:hypothetical protein
MIKIKLDCWWTNPTSIRERFLRQFVFDNDLEKYEFVLDDSYDFLVIFGRTDFSNLEIDKNNIFIFSQEPNWSPNDDKTLHNYSNNVFISDLRTHEKSSSYKEILLPMFYGAKGETDNRKEWEWSKELFDLDFSNIKNKSMSIVVTNNYNSHYNHLETPGINEIIYEKRVKLGKYLSDMFEDIDVWGTYQPDNGKNLHGEAWNKLIALKEFKFSLCFENTIQKNYISEKFWDAVLIDTVPIYIGCDNINEYIPEDCFINLKTFEYDLVSEKIKYILDNSDDLYKSYLPKLKELKKRFKTDKVFNLWERIKFEIENKI